MAMLARALAAWLALSLFATALPALEPQWGEVVPQRVRSIVGETASAVREDLAGRLPADFAYEGVSRTIGAVISSALPGGLGRFVGDLAGNFAWRAAYDAGSNVHNGQSVTKIDWAGAAASALGAAVLGGALGAVMGPIGGTAGAYIGWSLGEEILKELRSGRPFDLGAVLKRADILGSGVEGLAVGGSVALATKLLGGMVGGPMGLVVGIAVKAIFASVAATVASTALRKAREVYSDRDWEGNPTTTVTAPTAGGTDRSAYQRLVGALRAGNRGKAARAHADYVRRRPAHR